MVLVTIFLVKAAYPALAQDNITQPQVLVSPLLQAIKDARVVLEEELKKQQTEQKKPVVVPSKKVAVPIVLAVWNRDTNAISLVHAEKKGLTLKIITPGAPSIKVSFDNGVNSTYRMPKGAQSMVVGTISPIFVETKVKKKIAYTLQDVMYTPYSQDFFKPEVIAAGSDYLSFLIQDAFDDLRKSNIHSVAFPDRLLVDVIDPYLIKSIVVIEHADRRLFQKNEPEHAVGTFLANLALNEEGAFNLSVSSAGARGLVQFIPSTYALLTKRKDLQLISDFTAGMADHRNAIKAQAALLDEDLADMPKIIRDLYFQNPAKAGEFLAASYNGGSTRVRRAFTTWGDEGWAISRQGELKSLQSKAAVLKSAIVVTKQQITKNKKPKETPLLKKQLVKITREREQAVNQIAFLQKASLREETVGYVVKLKKVYAMFTAGFFATPNAPAGALPAPSLLTLVENTEQVSSPSPSSSSSESDKVCFSDGGCTAM